MRLVYLGLSWGTQTFFCAGRPVVAAQNLRVSPGVNDIGSLRDRWSDPFRIKSLRDRSSDPFRIKSLRDRLYDLVESRDVMITS